jgi:hypothetical protein
MTKFTKPALAALAGSVFTAAITLAIFAYAQAHFSLGVAGVLAAVVFLCGAAGTILLRKEATLQKPR